MQNHEEYQNAMNRITPSPEWKASTVQKMHEIRQEQPERQKKPLYRTKRVWLPVAAAAAFALVLIPAVLHGPQMQAVAGGRTMEAAENASPADLCREDVCQEEICRDGTQEAAAEAAPKQDETVNGLPILTWQESAPGKNKETVRLARNPSELNDGNPTLNLPQEQLPQELPVWYAPSGPKNGKALLERMQQTADYLDLPLLTYTIKEKPEGFPNPECWPFNAAGALMQPDYNPDEPFEAQTEKICWKLTSDGTYVTLSKNGEEQQMGMDSEELHSAALSTKADDLALEQFGELVGLRNPAHRCDPKIKWDGKVAYPRFSHFYYEEGQPGASIGKKLQDYCFKRVYGNLAQNGGLYMVRLVLPPNTPQAGSYPLRSLKDAQDALQETIRQEQENGLVEYKLGTENIVTWKLEYEQSRTNEWIQPVYVFTLETPLTPQEMEYHFEGSEQYKVYVEYRISAAAPEYYTSVSDQAQ